jgi:hypothetical protein
MSGGLQIFLNTWTDRWQLMKSMWANPCTDSDKAYVAIEIAAWLFHELMHGVCRLGQAKEWRVNFAERAFRWGMYNRYWFALRDSQCFLDQFTDGGVTDELLLRSFVHNTWGDNSASCKPCDPDSSLDPSIDKTNEGKTDEFSLETDLDRMNSNELGGW